MAEADPPIYPDKTISKLECVGHIQKRMGRNLTNLVTACKNKIYYNDKGKRIKGISGRNKLTKVAIYRIQGHYGAAIRNNVGNESSMREAIWAIFNHRAGDHDKCGQWCVSKKPITADAASDTIAEKANANVLPPHIITEMKAVFEKLTATELLSRCTHGGTQNVNESFHHVIWSLCPKEVFVGWRRLDLAVCSATLQYNDGKSSKLLIFPHLGVAQGMYCRLYSEMIDRKRIKQSAVTKKSKKARRKKQEQTSLMNTDNSDYGPGLCENNE